MTVIVEASEPRAMILISLKTTEWRLAFFNKGEIDKSRALKRKSVEKKMKESRENNGDVGIR